MSNICYCENAGDCVGGCVASGGGAVRQVRSGRDEKPFDLTLFEKSQDVVE